MARCHQDIADVNEKILQIGGRQLQRLSSGTTAAELQFDLLCRAALAQRRGDLEQELDEAESLRRVRAEAWALARRQREVIESLRQKQFAAYQLHVRGLEQRQLDDAFLLRREFLRRADRFRADGGFAHQAEFRDP